MFVIMGYVFSDITFALNSGDHIHNDTNTNGWYKP